MLGPRAGSSASIWAIRAQGTSAGPGAGRALVGCSGWSYPHWKGVVYPAGLSRKDWFAHYASLFGTVEVNNTFYQLPRPETFRSWAAQAPPGFVYALKVNRFGTHRMKLKSPSSWLPVHLERAVLLGEALGPNLLQLPPRWKRDTPRLAEFFELAEALEAELEAGAPKRLRWAVEVRDRSWLHDSTYEVLAAHQAALCWHDLLAGHPWLRTAGWAYARFHGPGAPAGKYAGDYGEERLAGIARQLSSWLQEGCDVFAYFNNDQGGAAVRDGLALARLLTLG